MTDWEFRTATRCTLTAYTHRSGKVDLSDAIIGFHTRKECKQIGSATFTLKALQNWQNLLFPNDMIAFYEDTGEGYEPEWVFWGFIDATPNPTTISQDAAGAPVLGTYVLQCSDFQKALDARLYQNLQLAGRRDFALSADFSTVGTLGTDVDLGLVQGNPADFLDAILTTTLGFGQQGIIPACVPQSVREQAARTDMRRRAVLRIPQGVRALYPFLQAPVVESPTFAQEVNDAVRAALARAKAGDATQAAAADALLILQTIVNRTAATTQRTIVDMMSFDFVERECIDGYSMLQPILPTQTEVDVTLNQLVYENTNEIVNELIFDLRPVASGLFGNAAPFGNERLGSASYASGTDVLGATVQTRYVPAITLREYPFSVAYGVDLTGLTLGSDNKDERALIANAGLNTAPLRERIDAGVFRFGPVFAQTLPDAVSRREYGGRVYYDYRTEIGDDAFSPGAPVNTGVPPVKHLDVVGISDAEILSDTLGRNSANIVNLVAVRDESSNALLTKMLLQDLLPIATPVSIQRDRLKPRVLPTKFLEALPASAQDRGASGSIGKRASRWGLLWDQWHQHDYEYLNGTVTLKRPRPDIRVGYRADFADKRETYYVEAVEQSGQFEQGRWTCFTVLELSRGQRVDPLPQYIPPQFGQRVVDQYAGFNTLIRTGGGDRGPNGRLGRYFERLDNAAVVFPSASQGANLVDQIQYPGPIVATPNYRPLLQIFEDAEAARDLQGGVVP